jgi:hypothetical protein
VIIKKNKVREYALQLAGASRSHKFTRVSQGFMNDVEYRTRQAISQFVGAHPSKGKTLRGAKE